MGTFRNRFLCSGLLVMAGAVWPLLPAQAHTVTGDLIVNGSFESPDVAGGGFSVFSGFLAIPGWSSTSGSGIEIQDNAAGSPFDGDQLVELDSFDNSNMFQFVSTDPGQDYFLNVAYSPRPGVAESSNSIDVFFNGALIDTLSDSGIGLADTSWTVFTYVVTGSAGSTSLLEFIATGTSDTLGGYLDDVHLAAVPLPSAAWLLGAGLIGLAALGRRKAAS